MRRQREEYERQKLLKGRQSIVQKNELKHHSPKLDPSLFKSNKNIHFKPFDAKTDEDLIEFIQIVDENDLKKVDSTKIIKTTPTKVNKNVKTNRKRPLNSTTIDSFINNSPTSSQSSINLSVYDDLDSDYNNDTSINTPFSNLINKNQQNNRKRTNLNNNNNNNNDNRSYQVNSNKRKRLN